MYYYHILNIYHFHIFMVILYFLIFFYYDHLYIKLIQLMNYIMININLF